MPTLQDLTGEEFLRLRGEGFGYREIAEMYHTNYGTLSRHAARNKWVPVLAQYRGGNCRRCTIDGVEFPSVRAAALALGVSEWKAKRMAVNGLGARWAKVARGVPTMFRGVLYPSITEAARQTGIPYYRLYYMLEKGRFE
jgi:hypothetical protein